MVMKWKNIFGTLFTVDIVPIKSNMLATYVYYIYRLKTKKATGFNSNFFYLLKGSSKVMIYSS
jgi:hypothetical protein